MVIRDKHIAGIYLLSGLILCLLMTGCGNQEDNLSLTYTAYPALNTLLESAPVSIINIDDVTVETVNVGENNILGRSTSLQDDEFIASVDGLMKLGDNLYVADGNRNTIWEMDFDGMLTRRIGRTGNGPGEFQNLAAIHTNGDYIYASDYVIRNLLIFDREFNYLTTVYHGEMLVRQDQMVVTDSHILIPNRLFNVENESDSRLVKTYNSTPPLVEAEEYIIPVEPEGNINSFKIDSNESGQVAFAFERFPFVFIYDSEMNLEHTVAFEREDYHQPDNPIMDQLSASNLGFSSLPQIIQGVHLSDNGDLFVVTSENRDTELNIYLQWIENEEEGYSHSKTYQFLYEDSFLGVIDLPARLMVTAGDTLFFGDSSRESIYWHFLD